MHSGDKAGLAGEAGLELWQLTFEGSEVLHEEVIEAAAPKPTPRSFTARKTWTAGKDHPRLFEVAQAGQVDPT